MSKIYVDEILPKDNATVDGSKLSAVPASAISSVNSSAMPSGSVLQVLQTATSGNGTELNTTSATFVTTNLELDITPSSTSSKILILANLNGVAKYGGSSNGTYMGVIIEYEGASIGQDFGSRIGYNNSTQYNWMSSHTINYLHSPSTTSSVNYHIKYRRTAGDGTVRLNDNGCNSQLILMEIAG